MEPNRNLKPSNIADKEPIAPTNELHEGRMSIYSWTPPDAAEITYNVYRPHIVRNGEEATYDVGSRTQQGIRYMVKVDVNIIGLPNVNQQNHKNQDHNLYVDVYEQPETNKLTILPSSSLRLLRVEGENFLNSRKQDLDHLAKVIGENWNQWKKTFSAMQPVNEQEYQTYFDGMAAPANVKRPTFGLPE